MTSAGVLEKHTTMQLIESVRSAKKSALILLEQDDQVGRLEFKDGQLVTARLSDLDTKEALSTLLRWQTGRYVVVKRTPPDPSAPHHVVITGISQAQRESSAKWLTRRGCTLNIVDCPQHALHVINYIRPTTVVTACPRKTLGLKCTQLVATLNALDRPPQILIAQDPASPCEDPKSSCLRVPLEEHAMEEALGIAWPGSSDAPPSDSARGSAPQANGDVPEMFPGDDTDEPSFRTPVPFQRTPGQPAPGRPAPVQPAPVQPAPGRPAPATIGFGHFPDDDDDEGTALMPRPNYKPRPVRPANTAFKLSLAFAALSIGFLVVVLLLRLLGGGPNHAEAQGSHNQGVEMLRGSHGTESPVRPATPAPK